MAKNVVSFNLDGTDYTGRPYGTSTTSAETVAKTVTCSDFSLTTGATVIVKFTYANTASSPTLNVNSTGAKYILYRGAKLTNSSYYWGGGDLVEFYYDGGYWNILNILNSSSDTKVNVVQGNTTKAYLLGTSTTPSSTATGVTAVSDTGVYLSNEKAGALNVGTLYALESVGVCSTPVPEVWAEIIYENGTSLGESYAPKSHTHNYAGSTSAGGAANSAVKLSTGKSINGLSFDGTNDIFNYCISSTLSSTADKIASLSIEGTFKLNEGAKVTVKFTNANTSASPTLNVESTGAKAIFYNDSQFTQSWKAGSVFDFLYDGTNWVIIGEVSDPNKLATITIGSSNSFNGNANSATKAGALTTARTLDGISFDGSSDSTRYASCTTYAGTTVKTASVTSGTFKLAVGARVTVKFTYANTASSPTLNIGSTGAKAIYWRGSALKESQYWQAGAVLDFVYNGSQYELIGIANPGYTMTTLTATSVTISSMVPNMLYRYTGNCTSITISAFASGNGGVDEYMLEFKASSSGCTLSLPSGVSWMNGTEMTVVPGKTHQVSIINNLAVGASFG